MKTMKWVYGPINPNFCQSSVRVIAMLEKPKQKAESETAIFGEDSKVETEEYGMYLVDVFQSIEVAVIPHKAIEHFTDLNGERIHFVRQDRIICYFDVRMASDGTLIPQL